MTCIVRPIFLTTPEEVAFDESCGMKLWYRKYQNGGGIKPRHEVLRDEMLEATRSDMRILSTMPDISKEAIQEQIDYILTGIPTDQQGELRAKELLYRRLGWFAAYALFIEPGIRRSYDTMELDEEIDLDRSPLVVRMRGGRLLRHKHGYRVEHRAFVTTQMATEKWRARWEFDILPHLYLLAAREAQEHKVDFSRMVGLNVGITAATPDAPLNHPYVYAYFNRNSGEWTHKFKMHDEDGGSWYQRPIWECPLSLTTWVEKCGEHIAEGQFPLSPQIPINAGMVQRWIDRRLYRERNIQPMKSGCRENNSLRNIHFPSITTECAPLHGPACVFKDLCWSETFMRDALLRTQFAVNLPLLLTHSADLDKPIVVPPLPRKTLSELVEKTMEDARQEAEERINNIIEGPQALAHAQAQYPAHMPTPLEMFPGVI